MWASRMKVDAALVRLLLAAASATCALVSLPAGGGARSGPPGARLAGRVQHPEEDLQELHRPGA